jgi:hypothetical protein
MAFGSNFRCLLRYLALSNYGARRLNKMKNFKIGPCIGHPSSNKLYIEIIQE